eukprot:577224-Rhodomonas_salina.1
MLEDGRVHPRGDACQKGQRPARLRGCKLDRRREWAGDVRGVAFVDHWLEEVCGRILHVILTKHHRDAFELHVRFDVRKEDLRQTARLVVSQRLFAVANRSVSDGLDWSCHSIVGASHPQGLVLHASGSGYLPPSRPLPLALESTGLRS